MSPCIVSPKNSISTEFIAKIYSINQDVFSISIGLLTTYDLGSGFISVANDRISMDGRCERA